MPELPEEYGAGLARAPNQRSGMLELTAMASGKAETFLAYYYIPEVLLEPVSCGLDFGDIRLDLLLYDRI